MAEKFDPQYNLGVEEGKHLIRVQALSFLEQRYMMDSVVRDSDEGRMLLKLARELSEWFRGQIGN